MRAPKLQLVRTREQTIEEALTALMHVMSDKSIPYPVRRSCAVAHTDLHGCRSLETIRRMEREQGLR
jgi:uncharacterized protein (UPF0147 family)